MIKPRVRVMQCQGRPLFILRARYGFICSFSWPMLLHKLINGVTSPKSVCRGESLERRLRVAGYPALLPKRFDNTGSK